MKTLASASASASALALLSHSTQINAFTPSSISPSSSFRFPSSFIGRAQSRNVVHQNTKASSPSSSRLNLAEECLLTPEGFGFSSPAERILKQTAEGTGNGFIRAKKSDKVIDVIDLISDAENPDVSLIFDDDDEEKFLGIFTEKDYVDVSLHSLDFFCIASLYRFFSSYF